MYIDMEWLIATYEAAKDGASVIYDQPPARKLLFSALVRRKLLYTARKQLER